MELKQEQMTQVELAKRAFLDAQKLCISENEYDVSRGVGALQDSLELMMFAAGSEEFDEKEDNFVKLLGIVSKKISGFKNKRIIKAINTARTEAKHRGVLVHKKNAINWLKVAEEFLDKIASKIVGCSFLEIDLRCFLQDGDAKKSLEQAYEQLQQKDFYSALISIRKALFLKFLSRYNISQFSREKKDGGGELLKMSSDAPYSARSKEWCDKYVKDPFDYIAIDWDHLFQNLSAMGISILGFENIYRLTPKVILYQEKWIWSEDFKIKKGADKSNTIYCYNAMVDMLLQKQQHESQDRYYDADNQLYLISQEEQSVYKKAAINSECVATIQADIKYAVKSRLIGLDGNVFYSVLDVTEKEMISGYILENKKISIVEK